MENTPLTIRIKGEELQKKLEQLAAQDRRTRTSTIEVLIEQEWKRRHPVRVFDRELTDEEVDGYCVPGEGSGL